MASPAAALHWLAIYEHSEALLRLRHSHDAVPQAELTEVHEGIAFWLRRSAALQGWDINDRVVRRGGQAVALTKREAELFTYLTSHTGLRLSSSDLAIGAWGDRLSGDQVRIYMRRLKDKIKDLGWTITAHRGQGYSLEKLNQVPPGPTTKPTVIELRRALSHTRALLQEQRSHLTLAREIKKLHSELPSGAVPAAGAPRVPASKASSPAPR